VTVFEEGCDETHVLPGKTMMDPGSSSLLPLWYLFASSVSGEAKRRNRGIKEEAKRRNRVISGTGTTLKGYSLN
jgi:hypothetical protein